MVEPVIETLLQIAADSRSESISKPVTEHSTKFRANSVDSGSCNSFNCVGHFKHVYDDDDNVV